MNKYICDICKKDFKTKCRYIKHTERKNKCKQNSLECDCGEVFNSRTTLWRHKKDCDGVSTKVSNTINNNQTNINNTQNNQMNVDGDVKLVKFGDENLSYISDDLFKSILGRGMKAVEELIDHSHFNPDHPENHNIYIANIQTDYIVVYDGKKWSVHKEDEFLEDIIYAKSDFLYMKFKELMDKMNEYDIKKFKNFISQRDEDKTMNKIKKELKLQFYNNRHSALRIRKEMESDEREERKLIRTKKKKSRISGILEEFKNLNSEEKAQLKALLNS